MEDIFCKIVKGELGTEFLIDNESLVVFKDIAPKAPVHYLIVAKKHIETINNTKDEDKELLGSMILTAKEAASILNVSNGYKLIFNIGKDGGQEVPHIHLHLLGGWGKNKD